MNNEIVDEVIELLQDKGLYTSVKSVNIIGFKELYEYEQIKSLDLFCPKCNLQKTFVCSRYYTDDYLGREQYRSNNNGICYTNRNLHLQFECPTCGKEICYNLVFQNNKIIKYGQYPSLRDLNINDIKKFKTFGLINKEYIEELKKAETCANESYYVAALLYLRRVFENLIYNLYSENKNSLEISEKDFFSKHLDEKVECLKEYLAIEEELYSHLYKLLSEGIHSLSEEECEKKYQILKSLLLDILEEQEHKKKKLENRKAIHQLISQNNGGANDEK